MREYAMSLRDKLEKHRPAISTGPAEIGSMLVGRFIAGQAWLAAMHESLSARSDGGVNSRRERDYTKYLGVLADLETLLRFTYPQFEGCARGSLGPCSVLAVLRCQWCSSTATSEVHP
jgi:hypothetical protein